MINLLPHETKRALRYARQNTTLRRWSVSLVVACVALALVAGGGLLYIKQTEKSIRQQIASGQDSLSAQNQEQVKSEVNQLTSSLKLVDQVLSRQVLFSKLLQQIGAAMPPGSVLTGLSINELEGGIDLQAAAVSYDAATQVQVNLSDPENKIFVSADILNIRCVSGTDSVDPTSIQAQYPCTVKLRALFADENPFLFINSEEQS